MKKNILLLLFLIFIAKSGVAQNTLQDYKTKTEGNKAERTAMLDLIRADLVQKGYPEFIFVVNHLKIKNGFAFFKGDATLKSGGNYKPKEDEDCCHVEFLLQKKANKWTVLIGGAFATDVWFGCLWKEHKAPKEIFDYTEPCE